MRQVLRPQDGPEIVCCAAGRVVVAARAAVELRGCCYAISPRGLRDIRHVGGGFGLELSERLLIDRRHVSPASLDRQ
ncbi:MAG: hypothetical protein WBX22_15320 [Silvibacterium sp.]